jgi:hypothetical protein
MLMNILAVMMGVVALGAGMWGWLSECGFFTKNKEKQNKDKDKENSDKGGI